jgi:transcriptional regulator with PAS, ATPase and Fis domain
MGDTQMNQVNHDHTNSNTNQSVKGTFKELGKESGKGSLKTLGKESGRESLRQLPLSSSLAKVAYGSSLPILMTGPTGCGKTRMAEIIHSQSLRKDKPFITVNLASIHGNLIESELFGHERGSFTGAINKKIGLVELAQGGTLFLDEIGELPLALQGKLLEFLQFQTFRAIGSNVVKQVNVRVIAATLKNLDQMVQAGTFREDLLYRLRVVEICLPALKDQVDSLSATIHEHLEEYTKKYSKKILKISSEVADLFESYPWPGNIRELRHVLEYCVLATEDHEIRKEHLPQHFLSQSQQQLIEHHGFQEALEWFEKTYIEAALKQYGWKINYTARKVGIHKCTLIRKMNEHGLKSPEKIKKNHLLMIEKQRKASQSELAPKDVIKSNH